ncbi:MAG TPA: type II CAAX endopeptidase family protein [Pseudobacteroides sp.]|uniref:CPBP family intramembrane glutamic endopeptidase n=1 Tax=Pseudobacteroides sp. TaxID=1968840 RepID=UPI002F921BD9
MDSKSGWSKGVTSFIKAHKVHYLLIYFLIFYGAWTLHRSVLSPMVYEEYAGPPGILLNGLIKVFIWAVPVFMYIIYIDGNKPLSYLKLNSRALMGIVWGLVIGGALIGINLGKMFLYGKSSLNMDFDLDKIINVVLVTCLTEEIVFRGFLLNKIEEFIEFWGANILVAILFVTIHFPIWIINEGGITIMKVIPVMALGILFGYAYKKTGSLWTSIIIHGANNFMVAVIGINF